MLSASEVSYGYPVRHGAGEPVVRGVSLRVESGTVTGLLGPNGCGKTTLLKLLAGVLSPVEGHISIDGRPLASLTRRDAARRIAIVPQETHPAFDFTVMEMVLMGRHPHMGLFQLEGPQDLDIARGALAATGTAHLADRPYATLSGGEKQRVVIAGALAQSALPTDGRTAAPGALLLDEPTASLDLRYQLEIAALLGRLNREQHITMVLATHDLNLAAALCDELVLLREGVVLAHGPAADVLTVEAVRALYDVDVDIRFHEGAGHLTIVPLPRRP